LSDNATLVFGRVLMLYAFDCLEEDAMSMVASMDSLSITNDQILSIRTHKASICKLMRPDIHSIVKGFGVKEDIIWRPMAKDWKEFNRADNFGEVVDSGKYLSNQV